MVVARRDDLEVLFRIRVASGLVPGSGDREDRAEGRCV